MPEEDRRSEPKSTAWERHGQSILAGLILFGIIAVFAFVKDTPAEMEKINGKINVLSETVSNLKRKVENYNLNSFTRAEANSLRFRIQQLETRMNNDEIRVQQIQGEQQKRGPRINNLEKKHGSNRG